MQEPIEFLSTTIEHINGVVPSKLFDSRRQRLSLATGGTRVLSKNPGSVSRRCIRGRGRVGASSAARNSDHFALLRTNVRRSANVSSARASALSRTNALTDRLEADAAASKVRLAERLSRRSNFSVRTARADILKSLDRCKASSMLNLCQDDVMTY